MRGRIPEPPALDDSEEALRWFVLAEEALAMMNQA